ncbi:MAG TPA: 2-succinyl-5-enolpyruvyl-6-hydroxy-3-cyclohexene-1-carboxylic-acid synthase [Acidimicrobiia bacterium]
MTYPNPSTALAAVLVDEMIRGGVRRVVASPGSRSTALLLAFAGRPEIDLKMHIDERSAAFRALGLSLATGEPVAVLTTSGSAAANLLPAVVEAERSMIPLVVITADRPAVMVRRRVNQTTDHLAIFKGFARAQVGLEAPSDGVDGNAVWRDSVARAVSSAVGGENPPGPVHLNVPFEEPTLPVGDDGRSRSAPYQFECSGADAGQPWFIPQEGPSMVVPELPDLGDRVLLAIGHGDFDAALVGQAARTTGVAVLATSRSGVRGGGVVNGYHHVLVDGFPLDLNPTGVIVVGDLNPADRILASIPTGAPVVHVDRWGIFSDPFGSMTLGVKGTPDSVIALVGPQRDGWSQSWLEADSVMRASTRAYLDSLTELSGTGLASTLDLVEWEALVVASSLAARDVDAHLERHGPVFSNRGVSGIDGFVSTAVGVGTIYRRTVAYTGDLAFIYDSNGFLGEDLPGIVFLVMDNNGGGLFDLLPQAKLAPDFERLFVTPPNRRLSLLAAFHGLSYVEAETPADVLAAIESGFLESGPTVVRVAVDRDGDVRVRHELDRLARQTRSNI